MNDTNRQFDERNGGKLYEIIRIQHPLLIISAPKIYIAKAFALLVTTW